METPENKQGTTRRDAVLGRLKTRHPDREFVDDEGIFDAIDNDYSEAEAAAEKMKGYEENSKKMVDMFYHGDPRVVAFFNACKDGQDPIDFLIENFGDDFREALDSEEGRKKYGEKHQKWLEKVAKEKELEEEAGRNLDESLAMLDQIQQEKGLTDEQAVQLFDTIHQMTLDLAQNKITREIYEFGLKALNYDADVDAAAHEGEIRGRNAKIEEKLRKKEMPEGIPPTLNSGAAGHEPKPKKKTYNPFVVNPEDYD